MEINWKVRLKNPVWWANIAAAVMVPVLTCFGLNWGDMTTWEALCTAFTGALGNPVVLAAVAVSVWNAVNDPTTEGVGDSLRALGYDKPHCDGKE